MITVCWARILFFQAEDGIRDLVRSRGLGDVYKRQAYVTGVDGLQILTVVNPGAPTAIGGYATVLSAWAVSYTHLTLPTIYSV